MSITAEERKVLLKSQQGELDAVKMYNAVKKYEPVAARFPEVESVKSDEQRHGDTVPGLL